MTMWLTRNLLMRTLLLLAVCAICGCGGLMRSLGENLGKGLGGASKGIGDSALAGVQQRISDPEFKRAVAHTLDSLMTALGVSAKGQVAGLLDSVRDEEWKDWVGGLVDTATGERTRENLGLLREELLGTKAQAAVRKLLAELLTDSLDGKVADLRNELLGADTRDQAAALLHELLGERTKAALAGIVDSASVRFSTRFGEAVGDNASVLKKYASELLITLGLIAAGVILLVWRNRQKYLRLTRLLATQVGDISDRRAYDEVTSRITTEAQRTGQIAMLNDLLKREGLLGEEAWLSRQRKKANMNSATNR